MKKTVFTTVVILIFTGLICLILFLFLPFAADRFLLPRIADSLPFSQKEISFSRITPWKVRGTLSLDEQQSRGVVLPRFEVQYSPGALIRGEIDTLLLESAFVHLEKRGAKYTLRGLQRRSKPAKQSQAVDFVLPARVDRIVLNNCIAVVHENNMVVSTILVEGIIEPEFNQTADAGYRLQGGSGSFNLQGDLTAKIAIAVTITESGYHAILDLQTVDIQKIVTLMPHTEGIVMAGTASLEVELQTGGLDSLEEFTGNVIINNFAMQRDAMVLQGAGEKQQLFGEITGNANRVDMRFTDVTLLSPVAAEVNLSATIERASKSFRGISTITPHVTRVPVSLEYSGVIDDSLGVELDFTIEGQPFTLGDNLHVAKQQGKGRITYAEKKLAVQLSGGISAIEERSKHIILQGIQAEFPFNVPALAPDAVTPGNLSIRSIVYRQNKIAGLRGAISYLAGEIQLNSRITSDRIDGFSLTCSGTVSKQKNAQVNCFLPKVGLESAALAGLVKLPEGMEFSGKVSAESRLTMALSSISGDARLNLEGGALTFENYGVKDVNVSLYFPELPKIRSAPAQLATIGSLEIGKIKMNDGKLLFRVDDSKTIFLERALLKWCKGRVETAGLRLASDMQELDATLYCDRLSYTDLLDQFGIGNAEGEGSLNGRLPVVISKKGIRFNDGFLFSTPGNSGIVRFKNTEQLRQGMGEAAQAAYLDYSMMALQNFSYNWTKLTFNTEEKQLLLTLQLDGKPAEPLPYGYKQGRIVRVEEGQGLQHPIRLDVNFRLPLEDLFKYGKSIQSMMEK